MLRLLTQEGNSRLSQRSRRGFESPPVLEGVLRESALKGIALRVQRESRRPSIEEVKLVYRRARSGPYIGPSTEGSGR